MLLIWGFFILFFSLFLSSMNHFSWWSGGRLGSLIWMSTSLASRKTWSSDVKTKSFLPTRTSSPHKRFLVGWLEKMFIHRAQLAWQVPLLHANNNRGENRHIITWAFLVLKCCYCRYQVKNMTLSALGVWGWFTFSWWRWGLLGEYGEWTWIV